MQQIKDHIAGKVRRGRKWNPELQKYEPAMFAEIYLYETDATGEPIKTGDYKLKNGKTLPNYKLAKILRLPLTTLSQVIEGNKPACNLFWSQKQ